MDSSVGVWALTPFGVDRGAEDIILLLLFMLLLLPALMQMWVGSLMSRSVDALLYNSGHIFFRSLVPVSSTHLDVYKRHPRGCDL